ncbi:hypothetical protein Y693_21880 [Bacillus anthracis str. 95014]|nr:hypothetical protein Y693_21880 [Bacillus anthracis str. 95014]
MKGSVGSCFLKSLARNPFFFVPSVVVVELDMVYKVAALAADTFACWVILETCEKSSFLQLGIYTYNMQ